GSAHPPPPCTGLSSLDHGPVGGDVILAELEQARGELIEFRHQAGEHRAVLLRFRLPGTELCHHAHQRRAQGSRQRGGTSPAGHRRGRCQGRKVLANGLVSHRRHSAVHTRFSRIWSMRNAGSTTASLITPTAAASGTVPTISDASTSTPRRFASSRITVKTFQMFVTRKSAG